MEAALFHLFSFLTLAGALLVITRRDPVNAAMLLVLTFFFMAGLFVLAHAWFLAAAQILVYAGAIMVLFLFVIMLLDAKEETRRCFGRVAGVGALAVGGALLAALAGVIRDGRLWRVPAGDAEGTTAAVGRLLFNTYLLPFEVASVLLLAATVGVIVLIRAPRRPDDAPPSA
ncbi:MAG: NADH-quinone oxidoreductase subunit J [Verrucomicrobiae bacterium]|nr:NADH-quinone oxidoreductase subunit J [Verrucomicrobiae bacterium]